MDDNQSITVRKVKSAMSSLFLTVLMAINVVLFVIGLSTTVPWIVCSLVFGMAGWQMLTYAAEKKVADLKMSVGVLYKVAENQFHVIKKYKEEQGLTDDGTNQDDTCLTPNKEEKSEA